MASLNLGWETAYTRGLRQLASLATNPGSAATAGVSRLRLHSDSVRLAVLLPQKTMLKIWNIDQVTRL